MSPIYLFIFSFLFIASYIQFTSGKTSKALYVIIVVIMILTAGLGFALSPDFNTYYKAFHFSYKVDWNDIPDMSKYYGMEKGYLYLNKLLVTNGFDFGMLMLVMASISLYLKSVTFYKYGGLCFLVLFIYSMPTFMFEEHVHIRQGFSTAFAIYSIKYIVERKLIKFFICITIGFQFHQSIMVFILAYWIAPIKINIKFVGWLVVLAIIGFYTGLSSILEIVMKFMPIGQEKFESYQNQLGVEGGLAVGDFTKIISILSIIIFNKYAEQDKLYCYFRNLFIFGVLLYFFLGKGIFGSRLPGFYLVFLGMTVGRMIHVFKGNSSSRNLVFFTFTTYTLILIFWFQVRQVGISNFGNYKTIFNKEAYGGIFL